MIGACAATVFVLGVVGALVWMQGGDGAALEPLDTPLPALVVEVDVDLTGVTTTSGRAPREVGGAAEVTDQVLAAVERFLSLTTVEPVVAGGEVTGLAELLTPRALAAARGADRPAVVTEGVPAAVVARVRSASAGIRLLDFGDRVLLAVVDLDIEVVASGTDGPRTRVTRRGEIILTPTEGAWLVDGYDLTATRDVGPGFRPAQWLWPLSVAAGEVG